MKSMLRAGVAAAALLIFTSAAGAESLKDDLARPSLSWSGMYLGIHGGYGWGGAKDSLECPLFGADLGSVSLVTGTGTPTTVCNGTTPPIALTGLANRDGAPWQTIDDFSDVKGWLAGGQLGYLHQMGRVVVGAELSASVGNLSDKGATILSGFGTGLYEGSVEANWLVSAVGRVGYTLSDNLLMSVHGGLAFAGTSFNSSAGYGQEKTAQGWVVGGQLDLRISEKATLFGSYSYYTFDNIEYQGNSLFGIISNFHEYDLDLHVVKVGLNYKLN